MNQPPDLPPTPFNRDNPLHPDDRQLVNSELESEDTNDSARLPPNHALPATKAAFKQLFVILIVIGVVIGGILSIGVLKLFDRLGLSDPPPPIERPNQ